jgi:glycosyltransferase involved in cell wall biosynthesis
MKNRIEKRMGDGGIYAGSSRPKISVIVPVYNTERNYVFDAVKSLKLQTLDPDDYEVVIRDDGSTDGTYGHVRDAIREYHLWNVNLSRREENKGQSVTRNEAIDMATSDLVTLFDIDDILDPKALEATLAFRNANPKVEYSYGMHTRVDQDGQFLCNRPGKSYDPVGFLHQFTAGPMKTYTTRLHEEIDGYDDDILYAQDWDHFLRATEALGDDSEKIARDDTGFYYKYRRIPTSVSGSKALERTEFAKQLVEGAIRRRGIISPNDSVEMVCSLDKKNSNYIDWVVQNAGNLSSVGVKDE